MFPLFLITFVTTLITRFLTPTQKAGKLKDFTFPQVNDGDPVYYMIGTNKITAPGMVWYGDFSTKAIKAGLFGIFSGLFGNLFSTTIGYKYYLGWQLVFCIGPGVTLRNLWFGVNSEPKLAPNGTQTIEQYREENNPNFTSPNDPKVPTPILSGDFTTFQNMYLENKDAFGGDQGGGGYELHVSFYSGDFDQPTDTLLPQKINGFIPPYRGLCYIVADGYIGNSTRLQPMTAELTRLYDPLGLGAMATIGDEGDANPANAIYELLTNNFGAASIPLPKMNTQSFITAGQTLFGEDEGISILSNSSPSAIAQVLQDILRQIDGVLYEDPETGLVNIALIRDDYVLADLLTLDESNIISFSNYATNLWSDTKNRIRVKYEDRLKDYDDRTAVAEDMANVSFQDNQVKGITVEHPYIKRAEHANRKAADELAVYSTPLTKADLTAQRISAALRPGSVMVLDYGRYEIDNLVLRLAKISFGDLINNHLTLTFVQDKFSKTDTIFAPPANYFSKPYTGAISIRAYDLVESPRFFNALQAGVTDPDAARLMSYVYSPNATQLGYNEWMMESDESEYVQTVTNAPFAPLAAIAAVYSRTSTADIQLQGISDATVLATATTTNIQTQAMNLILIEEEIMAYTTFVENQDGSYTLQGIERGLLDTVPAAHPQGAYLVFLDGSTVSPRTFNGTAVADVGIGSIAPNGVQDLTNCAYGSLQLIDRAASPYPPVNVTFDGVAYNPNISNANPVQVAWTRRDRLKTTVSFQGDPDEVPEAGTEYFAYVGNGNSFVEHDLGSGTSGSFTFDLKGANTVEFYAKLNGLKSTPIIFTTMVANGAGESVTGAIGTVSAEAPAGAGMSEVEGQGNVGTVTAEAPDGGASGVSQGSGAGSPGTVTDTAPGGTAGAMGADSHSYWAVQVVVPNGGAGIGEFQMASSAEGPNLCTGGTPFATGTYNPGSGFDPAQAFDGNVNTFWCGVGDGPDMLGYQFAEPQAIAEMTLFSRGPQSGNYGAQWPQGNFSVMYSDDGQNYTTFYQGVLPAKANDGSSYRFNIGGQAQGGVGIDSTVAPQAGAGTSTDGDLIDANGNSLSDRSGNIISGD